MIRKFLGLFFSFFVLLRKCGNVTMKLFVIISFFEIFIKFSESCSGGSSSTSVQSPIKDSTISTVKPTQGIKNWWVTEMPISSPQLFLVHNC